MGARQPGYVRYFYPRSPCGERLHGLRLNWGECLFLSTLSLRRATIFDDILRYLFNHFYPRSPCGERLCLYRLPLIVLPISIHALLAESDQPRQSVQDNSLIISIHALLAESDSFKASVWLAPSHFYPRSPCGERRIGYGFIQNA